MTVTELFVERILPILLPMPCLACGEPLPGGRHVMGLCIRCRGRLRPLDGTRCPGCGRPLRGALLPAGYRCGACRRRPPAFDRLLALWSYQPPLDAVIRGLKYRRLDFLGAHLARELEERARRTELEAQLVTFVPLHWRRHLVRGYNQAERIARPLARRLRLPAPATLVRTRSTPPQTRLARSERAGNLRGAFRARRRVRLTGRRVLLVDDVVTTGATLAAAAAALRAAGAAAITAVAIARTPGPEEPYLRRTVFGSSGSSPRRRYGSRHPRRR